MNHRFTLLEVLVLVILIGILNCLFLSGLSCRPRRTAVCAGNLAQLYKLMTGYSAQHGRMPDATGEDFWRSLTTGKPPLIEPEHLEVLCCPLRDEDPVPGRIDYRATAKPWAQLRAGDPVAADKPGNHGEKEGGTVILKDGSVVEAGLNDAIWKQCAEKLRP